MAQHVDAFLSVQSPYCYFAAPRLARLAAHGDVEVHLRLVSPGVIRLPQVYADRSTQEQDYFLLDVARTASFLGLAYAEADPYPVEFEPGSLWRPAAEQPRVFRLMSLLMAATELGDGLALYGAVMDLIWSGRTRNWHAGAHLQDAARAAGCDWEALEPLAHREQDRLLATVRANDEAILDAGHWGVPCFAVAGEPFYGQDRFDQLLWRLGIEPTRLGL